MSNRNNQKQIWADELFVTKLEGIRAKRVLAGKSPIKNVGELTKLIGQSSAFKKLEDEIINYDPLNPKKRRNMNKIKFDGVLF